MPPHVPLLCLFVCLFVFVHQCHMSLTLFVCFPIQIASFIDRQQANVKSNCTHCIRRGLGRRLRSSLLLNSSPRCNPPCRIPYLCFNDNSSPSTSRDISFSHLVGTHQSLTIAHALTGTPGAPGALEPPGAQAKFADEINQHVNDLRNPMTNFADGGFNRKGGELWRGSWQTLSWRSHHQGKPIDTSIHT